LTDPSTISNHSPTQETISNLLAEATPESAAKLDAHANVAVSKEIRKAARRALFQLAQRGIKPAERGTAHKPPTPVSAPTDSLSAWASAYDGAGNRLFLLILTPTDGGNSTVAQTLANDELGIRDLTLERRRAREIPPLMKRLEERIDGGLAVAELEPDYARYLIDEFRKINVRRAKTTPRGFIDLLPRIGAPVRSYSTPPVYDHLNATEEGCENASEDPADLFNLPWFEPWFFAAEDVVPWLERWIGLSSPPDASHETSRDENRQSIIREVTEKLIPDEVRSRYIVRLEESADVLRRRERIVEACMALTHARALKSEAAIAEVPFALAITARTLEAAAEMVTQSNSDNTVETGE